MSFQLQQASLVAELRKAGLGADAASRIASILGNSVQSTRTGPTTKDLTPSGLRKVTPNARKYYLQDIDFKEGDPDYRRQKTSPSEARARPQPADTVRTDRSPQQDSDSLGVSEGGFTQVRSDGSKVSVGLRVRQTGKLLTLQESSNELVGKNFRVEAQPESESGLRAFLEDKANELILKLGIDVDVLAALVGEALGISQGASTGATGGDGGDGAGGGGDAQDLCSQISSRLEVVTGVQCVNGNLVVTTASIPSTECP